MTCPHPEHKIHHPRLRLCALTETIPAMMLARTDALVVPHFDAALENKVTGPI
jgi:hypothetical protein